MSANSSSASGSSSGGGSSGAVVVGFDGSWRSAKALERAAAEAVERAVGLTLLTVVSTADDPQLTYRGQREAAAAGWDEATAAAAAGAATMRQRHPGLAADTCLVLAADTAALRHALSQALLLVLGTAGRQGPSAFLIGSTSRELVKAAKCPVLVVPETTPRSHPADPVDPVTPLLEPDLVAGAVVVGLRQGRESVGLLRLAADEATRRGTRLCVVHAHPAGENPQRAHAELDRLMEQASLDASLPITRVVTPEAPADALLGLALDAALLVVGTRGPLALARLALDSTSRPVLDAAHGPVLLVPDSVCLAAAEPIAPGTGLQSPP